MLFSKFVAAAAVAAVAVVNVEASEPAETQFDLVVARQQFKNLCIDTYCGPQQTTCMPCNPLVEENCTPDNVKLGFQENPTLCAQPRAVSDKRKLYGRSYNQRCRSIVFPGWKHLKKKKQPQAQIFVYACREGEFTCNSGHCIKWAEMPKVCGKGFKNDELDLDSRCNMANPEHRAKVLRSWERTDVNDYCKNQDGVRFMPFKCTTNFDLFSGQSGACESVGRQSNPDVCVNKEYEWEGLPAMGPSEECRDDCDSPEQFFNIPNCCVDTDSAGVDVCTHIPIFVPDSEVGFCNIFDEVETKCDVCTSEDYSYCCHANAEGAEGTVQCTNVEGVVEGTGGIVVSECANLVADTDFLPGYAHQVCLLSSQTGGDVIAEPYLEGVVLQFEMTPKIVNPSNEGESDCCCSVSCSCFGDPHCTSFFGDYEFTNSDNDFWFDMIKDDVNGFVVSVNNAAPQGVLGTVIIKAPNFDDIEINADKCVEKTGDYHELKDQTFTDYIALTYDGSMTETLFKSFYPPSVFVNYGKYQVEVQCKHFQQNNPNKWFNRLDITIKRSTLDVTDELGGTELESCCPRLEAVQEELSSRTGREGFCFREITNGANSFFNQLINSNSNGARVLQEKPAVSDEYQELTAAVECAVKEGSTSGCAGKAKGQSIVVAAGLEEDLSFEEKVNLIIEYAVAYGLTYSAAAADAVDNGLQSIQDLVNELKTNCFLDANHPMFDPSNEDNVCVEGMYLEAKLPEPVEGADDWKKIKFFPASKFYCDNSIKVTFAHTMIPGTDKYLTHDYELRLEHCNLDSTCGARWFCKEQMSVEKIAVKKYLYSSSLIETYKLYFARAIERCSCPGADDQCMKMCGFFGICPDAC